MGFELAPAYPKNPPSASSSILIAGCLVMFLTAYVQAEFQSERSEIDKSTESRNSPIHENTREPISPVLESEFSLAAAQGDTSNGDRAPEPFVSSTLTGYTRGPEATITLDVLSESVLVSSSVPRISPGSSSKPRQASFRPKAKSARVPARDGKVSLVISSVPIYVEEAGSFSEPRQSVTTLDVANSPFGAHPAILRPAFDPHYREVGVKWIRYGRYMAWDTIERRKGQFDWSAPDRIVSETINNGCQLFFTVKSYNRRDAQKPTPRDPMAPTDLNGYLNFLRKAVERYDGDGFEDAPGSPRVDYWQIENEVDGFFWGDTPQRYAMLLKAAYKTAKRANPRAKILIAGASSNPGFRRFYPSVLKSLASMRDSPDDRYFDILDIHWYGNAGEYKAMHGESLTRFLASAKETLANYGYRDTPIWITETGTHSGTRVQHRRGGTLPEQDEFIQAAELVRRYIHFIGSGVEKVFWYQMMERGYRPGGMRVRNGYFQNVGLINNPQNDGQSSKKLAYYSLQQMTTILAGTNWKAVESLHLGEGVYAYRFQNGDRRIHVLWFDPTPRL